MRTDSQKKVIAMVPARIGSTRLKMKNLALINGKPMVSYVLEAAKAAGVFDAIVLNSDSVIFKEIADRHGVDFYLRPESLGSSTTKSDDVVLDFIENHPCDIVAWVNSTSPLQPASEIREVVHYFIKNQLDSLIAVKDEQVHAIYNNTPINFNEAEKFAQTQDLTPVQRFVYSIMMWNVEPFKAAMANNGYAFFSGKVGYYPVCKDSAIIIKTDEDLLLAGYAQKAKAAGSNIIEYDPLVDQID